MSFQGVRWAFAEPGLEQTGESTEMSETAVRGDRSDIAAVGSRSEQLFTCQQQAAITQGGHGGGVTVLPKALLQGANADSGGQGYVLREMDSRTWVSMNSSATLI